MLLFYLTLVLVIQVSADLDLGRIREQITENVINRSPYDSIPKVGNKPVPVSVGFIPLNIQEADPVYNFLKIMFILRINWKDYRLKWDDPSKPAYHVKEVTVPAKEIWTPNIKVFKPVGNPDTDASEIVNCYRDGLVFQPFHMTIRTNCDLSNLTTENKATCSVKVTPWNFPSQEVSLSRPQDLILNRYFGGSKYQILNATQRANRVKDSCSPIYYDDVELIITFRRK